MAPRWPARIRLILALGSLWVICLPVVLFNVGTLFPRKSRTPAAEHNHNDSPIATSLEQVIHYQNRQIPPSPALPPSIGKRPPQLLGAKVQQSISLKPFHSKSKLQNSFKKVSALDSMDQQFPSKNGVVEPRSLNLQSPDASLTKKASNSPHSSERKLAPIPPKTQTAAIPQQPVTAAGRAAGVAAAAAPTQQLVPALRAVPTKSTAPRKPLPPASPQPVAMPAKRHFSVSHTPAAVEVAQRLRPVTVTARTQPRRLVDGFMFNSELELLEVRLHELNDVVDHFILVEGTHTLQNKPKELHFEKHKHEPRFAPFLPKILHVVVTDTDPGHKYWENEVFFRNCIGWRGVKRLSLQPDDLVMVTDVDELPSAEVLFWLKWHDGYPDFVRIFVRWSYYGFMWVNPKSWMLNAIVPAGYLKEHNYETAKQRYDFNGGERFPERMWEIGAKNGRAPFGGWHCSWCFHVPMYLDKLRSFAHKEQDTAKNRDVKRLAQLKARGEWMGGGARVAHRETVEMPLFAPQYVLDNQQRFDYLIDPTKP